MVELTWQSKYDANAKRAAPLRVQLPFQTVETVNESARHKALDLFSAGHRAVISKNDGGLNAATRYNFNR